MFLDLTGQLRNDPNLANQVIGLPGPGAKWLGENSWIYLMIEELPRGKAIADSLAAIPGRIRRFGWLDQDAAYYIRALEEVLEAQQAAETSDNFQELNATLQWIESELDSMPWFNDWRYRLSQDILPVLLKGFPRRIYSAEAHRRLVITAIALHRHRSRHGAFPKALDGLVPDFLPAPPKDPMDGQPLRYRLHEDGSFLLYSIGADFKDDGGDASAANPNHLSFQSGKDWVWPRAATREEIDAYHASEQRP